MMNSHESIMKKILTNAYLSNSYSVVVQRFCEMKVSFFSCAVWHKSYQNPSLLEIHVNKVHFGSHNTSDFEKGLNFKSVDKARKTVVISTIEKSNHENNKNNLIVLIAEKDLLRKIIEYVMNWFIRKKKKLCAPFALKNLGKKTIKSVMKQNSSKRIWSKITNSDKRKANDSCQFW